MLKSAGTSVFQNEKFSKIPLFLTMLKAKIYKNNKLEKLLERYLDEIEKFFNITKPYNKPIFILLETREIINCAYGRETEDWVVGWSSGKYIFLLDPENYEKENKYQYSEEEYSQLVKHEITHFFYNALVGTTNPRWLLEGIGSYISGQTNRYKDKLTQFEFFLSYYSNTDSRIYKEAGFVVKTLIDRFGKEKLLDFIKALRGNKSPQDVEKVFQEIYRLDLSYSNMNKILCE